jgi:hypothetical protein
MHSSAVLGIGAAASALLALRRGTRTLGIALNIVCGEQQSAAFSRLAVSRCCSLSARSCSDCQPKLGSGVARDVSRTQFAKRDIHNNLLVTLTAANCSRHVYAGGRLSVQPLPQAAEVAASEPACQPQRRCGAWASSCYVANFRQYSRTYATVGAVVILTVVSPDRLHRAVRRVNKRRDGT